MAIPDSQQVYDMKPLPRSSKGFTLIELLVVIAIIALLAGILLPALNGARRSALSVRCKANLQQWATAFFLYADDWNGFLPPDFFENDFSAGQPGSWPVAPTMRRYVQSKAPVQFCPGDEITTTFSYAMNFYASSHHTYGNTPKLERCRTPTTTFLLFDYDKVNAFWAPWFTGTSNNRFVIFRHGKNKSALQFNVAFVDGHVETLPATGLLDPLPFNDPRFYVEGWVP